MGKTANTSMNSADFGNENENEQIPFEKAESFVANNANQISKFKQCLNDMETLLYSEASKESVLMKMRELEQIYNKKTGSFKEILSEQAAHYKSLGSQMKEKLKTKSQHINELEEELEEMKTTIEIYGAIEIKYADAKQEIERLNGIIRQQKNGK